MALWERVCALGLPPRSIIPWSWLLPVFLASSLPSLSLSLSISLSLSLSLSFSLSFSHCTEIMWTQDFDVAPLFLFTSPNLQWSILTCTCATTVFECQNEFPRSGNFPVGESVKHEIITILQDMHLFWPAVFRDMCFWYKEAKFRIS